jgi:hypothetical protein
MLSRMFSGGRKRSSSGAEAQRSLSDDHSPKRKRWGRKEEQGEPDRLGDIRKTMEEEHIASGVSKNKVSMADKLDSHKAGTPFKYAVIGNAPSEERKGVISRLKTYKAPAKSSNVNLSDIPAIRLTNDAVEFSMVDALKGTNVSSRESYCLIDSVLIHFVPLDSFLEDKSVVTVQMNDFRKTTNSAIRVARVDNTMAYNVLFCLDYCVETRDLSKMTLSFACPQKNFQEGISWGAVKVIAQVAFMSFPRRMPVIETLAVAIFADTDLQDYDWDPREFDAVLGPQALKGMKGAHKRGEIENLTIPRDDEVSHTVTRTIMGNSLEEESPESAITSMKQAALARGRPVLKSGMKKSSLSSYQNPSLKDDLGSDMAMLRVQDGHTKDERDDDSVVPGDSASMAGESPGGFSLESPTAAGKRIVKFDG